ncbi:Chemotaxis protein methyltransferase CheR [Rhodopirellula islandica]|uniref:Chemotaxis protein methyltransferase CheR n=1 Tax=Rhodopirellula islandica TaxID=595434 RepID=A0A0J1BHM9_RHOIS|nr:chemotaxis protein CheB [Rhodopirellula islandica]KLU06037.1 Chemotaxis protein methyltransferase CheR [Rhodopirellula islandica]
MADTNSPDDAPIDSETGRVDSNPTVRATPQHVVGIGASAGGLEALEKLFGKMPVATGMSFVVVQHLSPDFKSHMDDLLRRVTNIPVEVVDNGVQVQPDTIYLIPAKKEMVISNGKLLLTDRGIEKVLTHPIDQFLRSLAQDVRERAIGIILSGTGSDGSRGVVEISNNHGLVVIQDPATCKFDSMPMNARNTGQVDLELAPERMGEALQQYLFDGQKSITDHPSKMEEIQRSGLERVFQLLKQNHGIDFNHYKVGTVHRRIQRRMDLLHLDDLTQYVAHINEHADEVNELYRDLLIGVTKFFRDRDAFDALENRVIPELIERAEDTIRIWVCGCATGEEAYSIAMMMREGIERSARNLDFKMFATDPHRGSLQTAATGFYSEAQLNEISQERRDRFFTRRDNGYVVKDSLRRSVVFAAQNVINDPPFTQMDLVSCRNMLIYLQSPAQRKTLSLFHFALKANGILFLGPSESVGDIGDEFDAINSQWKLFRKRRDVRLPIELRMPLTNQSLPRMTASPPTTVVAPSTRRGDNLLEIYNVLLADKMPPSVVIDTDYRIIHTFPGMNQYLRVPDGTPSDNVLHMVSKELRASIGAAVTQAVKQNKAVHYHGIPSPIDGPNWVLDLIVQPYQIPKSAETCILVQFKSSEIQSVVREAATDSTGEDSATETMLDFSSAAHARIEDLEQELNFNRQNLQATIEELETSNEELQATNEEMVASNEELQSTNEELQSVNEELYSVNAELQIRVNELNEANADMVNLLATTRVGVVFLDSELRIRRVTPEISRLLSIEQDDAGRLFESFIHPIDDKQFLERIQTVRDNRIEIEWEVTCRESSYLVRALPYLRNHEASGVVLAFIDVNVLRKAELDVLKFKFMADENIDALVLLDQNGKISYANRKMCEQLGYAQEELSGQLFSRFKSEMDPQTYDERLQKSHENRGDVFESWHRRKDATEFPVEIALTPVTLQNRPCLFASIRDISLRKSHEAQMRLLSKAIESAANGIVITDCSQSDHPIMFVNQGFMDMTGFSEQEILGHNCRFLQGHGTDPETIQSIHRALDRGESVRELIKNYRKDGEPFWNDLYITPVHNEHDQLTHFVGVQNDVTERIESARQTETNERTIRLLMDSTAEGIFGLDVDGTCTFSNEKAARMLGYRCGSEIIGLELADLAKPCDAEGHPVERQQLQILSAIHNGEALNRYDERFCRQDGGSFPVEYWCHPIHEDDKIIGAVVTFVDIEDRLRVETELREAKLAADAANDAKSHFLANMSHELRTPLSAMLGFTKILQEDPDESTIQEYLATIQRNGDYLLRLLGDVLDLSRIEANKFTTANNSVSLGELLGDIFETMKMRTQDYENTLHFDVSEPLPQTITTDSARFRQIMINLIANAIKFAPKGRVDVIVRSEGDEGQTYLLLKVVDNGIGIADEKLRTLFQPFVQADATISNRFGGTGLGLSITKRLVNALGGTIQVNSTEGEGSEFAIRLPVDPIGPMSHLTIQLSDEKDNDNLKTTIDQDIQLNSRILIADDMRDVRFVAQHFLKKAGCEVEVAENGRQAVDMIVAAIANGSPFELCLMDMQMPELDGLGAVRELRNRGIEMPVIALTADAMKGTRRRLISEGFDEYLSKPLKVNRLLRIAKGLLDG